MSFSNADTGDKAADPYRKANLETVDLKTKVEDLVTFITKCKFGMLTTHEASTGKLVSRCMALAATETQGIDLLFHTNTESGKTNDVSSNSQVNISFTNSSGEWASLAGEATVVTDRALVKEHYSPILKAWMGDLGDGVHDGSANDPRIGVIRVRTTTATYDLVAKNIVSRATDIVGSAVTGNPPRANKLREISEADIKEWRFICSSASG